MGSWWAGTGRVRVKIVNNVHGHLRSRNFGKRIMRCSFLARRLVVCLERVTTATIKQGDPKMGLSFVEIELAWSLMCFVSK
jgi:hypothetical protein